MSLMPSEKLKINIFSNAQLKNAGFVDKNVHSCLSSKNFSCQTYPIVSHLSQTPVEERTGTLASFLFLPNCMSLQVLNPNFSSESGLNKESLSLLISTKVAQLTLSSGALNDTDDLN
ncbi:unnamed protein product, partial [Coregonus sp. 'balchen']